MYGPTVDLGSIIPPMAPDAKIHSGRLNVRLPTDLHAELAIEAARQGVSLNTLIVALLAGGISFKQR